MIRQNEHQIQILWCEFCQAEVEMTARELAPFFLEVTERVIYWQVENGSLHFFETETGLLVICLKSINSEKVMRGGIL